MPGSGLRKIPVLIATTRVPQMIPAPADFPTSTNNPAYPANAPQAQVSPDTHPTGTVQFHNTKPGTIHSHSIDFGEYKHLNATNQTTLIVNAYGSHTTHPHLTVFDKAFNVHTPPSTKVSYSIGCPAIKPNATRLDSSFDSANKARISFYCSTPSNPAFLIVTGTSATGALWAAMITLANQHHTGQGHNPLHIDSAVHRLPERTSNILSLTPIPPNITHS
jgi:hypothetical protein